MKSVTALCGIIVLALLSFFFLGGSPNPFVQKVGRAKKSQIERGKYVVTIAGCNDCHSPKIFIAGQSPQRDGWER